MWPLHTYKTREPRRADCLLNAHINYDIRDRYDTTLKFVSFFYLYFVLFVSYVGRYETCFTYLFFHMDF